MKQIISVLLVLVLCIGLVSCAKKSSNDVSSDFKETSSEITSEPKTEEVSSDENTNASATTSSEEKLTEDEKKQIDEFLSQYLDLSEYKITKDDKYSVDYTSQIERKYTYPDSVTIDGVKFKFPFAFSDLEKAGWRCRNNTEQMVDGASPTTSTYGKELKWYTGVSPDFYNEDEKIIGVQFVNLASEEKAVRHCTAVGVILYCNYQLISSCYDSPDFKLGVITKDSSLNEIIKKIGRPKLLKYNKSNEEYTFYFSTEESIGSMYINCDSNGKVEYISFKNESYKN